VVALKAVVVVAVLVLVGVGISGYMVFTNAKVTSYSTPTRSSSSEVTTTVGKTKG
jgi:hypothetical protein